MAISQLDLLLAGNRAFTNRLSKVEQAVRVSSTGYSPVSVGTSPVDIARRAIQVNGSFEYADRGSLVPQNWTTTGTLTTTALDGLNALQLTSGQYAQQTLLGIPTSAGSFVVAFRAKALSAAALTIIVSTLTGSQYSDTNVVESAGAVVSTSGAVPADGQWYTVWRSGYWDGISSPKATITCTSGTVIIDAVQIEYAEGTGQWLTPSNLDSVDPTAAIVVRQLSADNIIAGTVRVGGDSQTNPVIRVYDTANSEIVVIGTNSVGYRGVHVTGDAGIKLSGNGSIATEGAIGKAELSQFGLDLYDSQNRQTVSLSADTGNIEVHEHGQITIGAGGAISVGTDGEIFVGDWGTVWVGENGKIGAGSQTGGSKAVLTGGGLGLWSSVGVQTLLLSSETGKAHIIRDAFTFEPDGRLSMVVGRTWADKNGFWNLTQAGYTSFGVAGTNGNAWGGLTLDEGDVLIGTAANGVSWDASAASLRVRGQFLVEGAQHNVWINDGYDGQIAVGGKTKASAPFRVSPAGALTATSATVSGTIQNTGGSIVIGDVGLTLAASTAQAGDVGKYIRWRKADNLSDGTRIWQWSGAGGNYLAQYFAIAVSATAVQSSPSIASFSIGDMGGSPPTETAGNEYSGVVLREWKGTLYGSEARLSGRKPPVIGSGYIEQHNLVVSGTTGVSVNGYRIDDKISRLDWLNQSVTTTASVTFRDTSVQYLIAANGFSLYGNLDAVTGTIFLHGDRGVSFWENNCSFFTNGSSMRFDIGGTTRKTYLFYHPDAPLSTTQWDKHVVGQFTSNSGINQHHIQFATVRTVAGSNVWTTCNTRIQRVIDSSPMRFIDIGGPDGKMFGFNVATPDPVITVPNVADNTGRPRANAWDTYSSRRWKTNIVPLSNTRALALLCGFDAVTYTPINGGDTQLGFIAEDVSTAGAHEAVTFDESGQPDGLLYDRIPTIHHQVLKYVVKETEELRGELVALRGELQRLTKRA